MMVINLALIIGNYRSVAQRINHKKIKPNIVWCVFKNNYNNKDKNLKAPIALLDT